MEMKYLLLPEHEFKKKLTQPDDINHSLDSTEGKSLCSSDSQPPNGRRTQSRRTPRDLLTAATCRPQPKTYGWEKMMEKNPSTQAHKRIETHTHTQNVALTTRCVRYQKRARYDCLSLSKDFQRTVCARVLLEPDGPHLKYSAEAVEQQPRRCHGGTLNAPCHRRHRRAAPRAYAGKTKETREETSRPRRCRGTDALEVWCKLLPVFSLDESLLPSMSACFRASVHGACVHVCLHDRAYH